MPDYNWQYLKKLSIGTISILSVRPNTQLILEEKYKKYLKDKIDKVVVVKESNSDVTVNFEKMTIIIQDTSHDLVRSNKCFFEHFDHNYDVKQVFFINFPMIEVIVPIELRGIELEMSDLSDFLEKVKNAHFKNDPEFREGLDAFADILEIYARNQQLQRSLEYWIENENDKENDDFFKLYIALLIGFETQFPVEFEKEANFVIPDSLLQLEFQKKKNYSSNYFLKADSIDYNYDSKVIVINITIHAGRHNFIKIVKNKDKADLIILRPGLIISQNDVSNACTIKCMVKMSELTLSQEKEFPERLMSIDKVNSFLVNLSNNNLSSKDNYIPSFYLIKNKSNNIKTFNLSNTQLFLNKASLLKLISNVNDYDRLEELDLSNNSLNETWRYISDQFLTLRVLSLKLGSNELGLCNFIIDLEANAKNHFPLTKRIDLKRNILGLNENAAKLESFLKNTTIYHINLRSNLFESSVLKTLINSVDPKKKFVEIDK